MSYIKQYFNIRDLEVLSGIKAHTIRMWEKRYGVLEPERTDTNIRVYDINSFQKILNIAFLNENGYKISRISKLNPEEIDDLVKSTATHHNNENRAIKSLKVAMINFDQALFLKTYDNLLAKKTFREIFNNIFIPLLDEIGILWQTNTINPAHEHFISNLIRQKLYLNIEKLQREEPSKIDKTFILFLPQDEIHDLGLLYVNYEILLHGYKAIFLGHSLPLKDLVYLSDLYTDLHFISYLTVKPDNVKEYIEEFENKICSKLNCKYWILGRKAEELSKFELPENIQYFKNVNQLLLNF